jgi:hypothetical protein
VARLHYNLPLFYFFQFGCTLLGLEISNVQEHFAGERSPLGDVYWQRFVEIFE